MATLAGRCWTKTVSFAGSSFRTFRRSEQLSASIILGDGGGGHTTGVFAERKYHVGESFSRMKSNNEHFQLLRKQSLSSFATAPFTRRFCSFNNGPRLDLFPDEPKIKRPSPLRLMKVFWNFFNYYMSYDRNFSSEEFGKGTHQVTVAFVAH